MIFCAPGGEAEEVDCMPTNQSFDLPLPPNHGVTEARSICQRGNAKLTLTTMAFLSALERRHSVRRWSP